MTTKPAVDPRVFLEALRRLESDSSCCYLIDWHYDVRDTPTPEMAFFRRLYGQERTHIRSRWWGFEEGFGARIIALQLAACVAEDNALPPPH